MTDAASMLHDALLTVHRDAGEPRPDELVRHASLTGAGVTRNTLYELLGAKTVPAQKTVEAFLAGCLHYAQQHHRDAAVARYRDARWRDWVDQLRADAVRQRDSQRLQDTPQASMRRWSTTSQSAWSSAGGASVLLADAIRDVEPVMAAVLDNGFTGREWLISEIDQFIGQRPCGYVWVEAPAGMGKSALAAHLVHDRGWVGHFARLSRGGSTRVGLQNLAGQLVERYELSEYAPGRMLPEQAFTPDGFERVLGEAARSARKAEQPLVLVVDGADEADVVDGLPWGLPANLPKGVFVVGTYRTGFPPPPARPSRVLSIDPEDHRNQWDLANHLEAVVREKNFAARLAEAGVVPERFVADLAKRCGGIWVYLRYVLEEIRYGLRDPRQLDDLPADLSSFYTAMLERWSADQRWREGLLPLIATLAVAGEPLPIVTLASLSGVDEPSVRDWCHGLLRPFLTATVPTPQRTPASLPMAPLPQAAWSRRFAIYHASMRELLTGIPPYTASPDRDWMWSELLRPAAITAHDRIVDHYLTLFGGLDTDLARLAGDPNLAVSDDGYSLRHLAQHLVGAGRTTDLHRLLCAEQSSGRSRATSVWFTAHDAADTIDDYLADIATARQDSQHRTDSALAAGLSAPSLTEELRYWLITASIASLTTTIPAALLVSLLKHRLWTATRALGHARRLPKSEARSEALVALLPYLPAEQQPVVLAEALDATTDISDNDKRAEALAALAPHLPPGQQSAMLLTEVLDAALNIGELNTRVRVLGALAPHLSTEQLAKALDAATDLTSQDSRARLLAAVAPHLPAEKQPAVLATALDAANRMASDYYRAEVLAALAPYLPTEQQGAALAKALDAASRISRSDDRFFSPDPRNAATADHHLRALALAALVPCLPAEQRGVALAKALDAATHIRFARYRAEALGAVAPHLPAEQMAKPLAEVLDAATRITIEREVYRAVVLGTLAPHLSTEQLAKALDAASRITNEGSRARVLGALAPYLLAEQQPAVLTEALDAATHVTDDDTRALVLGALAPHLPAGQQPVLLAEALNVATHVPDGGPSSAGLWAEMFGALVPHLPAEQQPAVLAKALNSVTHIANDYFRLEVLAGLAPHLSADLLVKALEAAAQVANKDNRPRELAALVPYLPAEQRPAVLAEVLNAATHVTSDYYRAEVLGALVPYLPAEQRPAVLGKALHAAARITNHHSRADVLGALIPHLPAGQLAEALDTATRIISSDRGTEMLGALAPHLTAGQLAEALETVTHVTSDYSRAMALGALVPYLPAEQQPTVLAEALDAATHITYDYYQDKALATLAPHLSAEQLTKALSAAPYGESSSRRAVLARADEVFGRRTEYVSLLRLAFLRVDRATGLDVMTSCIPALLIMAGPDFCEHALVAVRAVHRWWP